MGRHGVMDKSVNYLSTRHQGSADRIPVFLFLLFVNVPRANSSEAMRVSNGTGGPSREKKGGSGESKKKDRQAFQEWLRERRKKVRRRRDNVSISFQID